MKHRSARLVSQIAAFIIFLILSVVLGACDAASTPTAVPTTIGLNAAQSSVSTTSVASSPTPDLVSSAPTADIKVATATTGVQETNSEKLPRYEKTACPFQLVPKYEVEGRDIDCGKLTVAEEHAKPNGKTITLPVAIFKSSNPSASKIPLFYLSDGPGGGVENILRATAFGDFSLHPLLDNRSLVFFDQRGAGYSQPSLYCQELEDASYSDLDPTAGSVVDNNVHYAQAMRCKTRLIKAGINLSAYNSRENAADLEDLRKVLGYDKIDLYGASYGTRLALTAMRDRPQGIRSVVLDGTYPPQASDLQAPANAERAFLELFRACAADNDCNKNYPELKDNFSKTYARLNQQPVKIDVKIPGKNKTHTVTFTGRLLVEILFELLYDSEVIPVLPALLDATYREKYDLLKQLLPSVIFPYANPAGPGKAFSDGMYYSVECAEQVQFITLDEAKAAAKDVMPEIRDVFLTDEHSLLNVCYGWGVKKGLPVEKLPITSDLPTLVLAGQFDPITPPSNGLSTTKTLSHSTFVEFPGLAHTTLSTVPATRCVTGIVESFLENSLSKVDMSCSTQLKVSFVKPANLYNYLIRMDLIQPVRTK